MRKRPFFDDYYYDIEKEGREMDTIKVKKSDLLAKLHHNRAKHREIFEKALEGYRTMAIKKLEESLADARLGRKIETYLNLVEPMDQTKDYDQAIAMLEMSVEDVIVLSRRDFGQYVMDDWGWKEQFIASNSTYTAVR